MDGETGEFTHLLRRKSAAPVPPYQFQVIDASQRLMVSGMDYAEIFDFNDLRNEREPDFLLGSVQVSGDGPNAKKQEPILKQVGSMRAVYHRNALWGMFHMNPPQKTPWVCFPLQNDSHPEPLPLPQNLNRIKHIIPHPNGKDLIVGDGGSLVLLRFE